jgi:5-methylcytosine-specific restriction protein A
MDATERILTEKYVNSDDFAKNKKKAEECFKKENNFRYKFPLEKVKTLTIDEYAEGNPDRHNQSFCWWVECYTKESFGIRGGTADRFGVYYGKNKTLIYSKKFGSGPDDAFLNIKKNLVELIEAGKTWNLEAIRNNLLSPLIKAKLLYLYYPEKMFPIFSNSQLSYICNTCGLGDKKDPFENNKAIIDYFKKSEIFKKYLSSSVEMMYFLYSNSAYGKALKALKTDSFYEPGKHVWIIPSDPRQYDVEAAFKELKAIDWRLGKTKIVSGDVIFIYLTEGRHRIEYKCLVAKTGIKVPEIDDKRFWKIPQAIYDNYMELFLISSIFTDELSIVKLREHGIAYTNHFQGPFKPNDQTIGYINAVFVRLKNPSTVEENLRLESLEDEEQKKDVENSLISEEPRTKTTVYQGEKAAAPITTTGGRIEYPRNPAKKAQALFDADYCCEIDKRHMTFIRESDGKPYTEAHHLIPMAYQNDFLPASLDVQANIVSLCSNCHNQIHYGKEKKEIITRLFQQREKLLKESSINITLEQLLKYYGC